MTTTEAARDDTRRTRLGRRVDRSRWLPWVLAPIVLPAVGAAVAVALVETVELDTWPEAQAGAALGAALLIPAALSAWSARRQGVVEAIAWAIVCLGVEVSLVFGVAFLALGLGPGT